MDKIAKLPKNFVISPKDYGDNPLWPKFISWLNEKYNVNYNGKDENVYYGIYNNLPYWGKPSFDLFSISIYQWYSAVNHVPDFTIPGTEIGNCKGLEYGTMHFPTFDNNYLINKSLALYTKKVFINNNEICVAADGDFYGGENYFVFRLDDLIKNYKKNNKMEKKLLGYKIKEKYVEAYIKLFREGAPKGRVLKEKVSFEKNSIFYQKTKYLKILDAWFDKVYETTSQLPKINGYEGKYDKDKQIIKYGCAKFPFVYLKTIHQNIINFNNVVEKNKDRYNRTIQSIELSSGVKIDMKELKDIIRFFDYYKDPNLNLID